MNAYYNEFEPYAAQWLRNLINAGHIAPGDVDERSITEVQADDLRQYTQCHFFAGIGGWSHALRIAGWDDERPVWTGSPPCQPYSTAGENTRQQDERHLWPAWFRLVRESKPATIFAEQVDAAITAGWLDDAFHDLETEAYTCAAAVLPALSVRKTHNRPRLFFVAESERGRQQEPWKREGRTAPSHDRQADCSFNAGEDGYGYITDGSGRKWPAKSGLRMLADGIPASMGRLRAYGNAIVPEVAAEFIKAFDSCRP